MKIIFTDRTKEILNEMFAPDCETIKEFFDKEKTTQLRRRNQMRCLNKMQNKKHLI